ncbi:RmlC-like cupin domain [Pseudocohnilembus persalinus]|uniref:RmlC-like cupin domain n=1 Tax=Pseudocohnilembus persalinus TaxID=266149 RepID=A0A0V0R6F4_PSEPJ|nr:RmlC-like cupin domain [Pseudocohnilembus persalinus]|eukprot:KRX10093.1 RmlC-like cupin domain [Pseudocohnilembus persalinus]
MFISYENLKYFFRKRAFGDNYENEEELKKLIQKEQNQIQKDIQNKEKIPILQKLNTLRNQDRVCIFFSSSIAQFLGYVVAQPFDYFKCNAQSSGNKYKMQNKGLNKLYGGFWANQYGALTFYSTFWPTVEEVKIYFKRNYQQSGFGVNCVAGGIGGILATLTSHPFDVLKLQKQLFSCENQKSNVQIAKEIIKQNGIGGLYVGIWPRLIKLFLYGSSMNAVYEFTFQTISQRQPDLRRLDPFLMLDYFSLRLPAGFPDHPHRGFETITYILKGSMYHEDFAGNRGTLLPGDIQWMTAGKGIVHAEMPGSFDEQTEGFQLWLNLSAKQKMIEPSYQEFKSKELPIIQKNNCQVKLIAGEFEGQKGPIQTKTDAYFLDIKMQQNAYFSQFIPMEWETLLFVYEGSCTINGILVKQNQSVQLSINSKVQEMIEISTNDQQICNFIIISGKPINEPIQAYGPFVMNNQQQIQQAFKDYKENKNGFENNYQWKSKISDFSNKNQYQNEL